MNTPVLNALERYRAAVRNRQDAINTERRAMEILENIVIEAFGEDGYMPDSSNDPVSVLCDGKLITILAQDERPALTVEKIKSVK